MSIWQNVSKETINWHDTETYHHLHTDAPVHGVHEYVKLVWVERNISSAMMEQHIGKDIPRHRIGHPIDSHRDSSKQIVENDFSPPLSDRGSFSLSAACVAVWSSVCT